jgi:hypothetical protein
VILSVGYILFSLLNIPDHSVVEAILLRQFMELLEGWLDLRSIRLNDSQKIFYGVIADVLTNDELILSDLLIRIVVVVFLTEVDSHTP